MSSKTSPSLLESASAPPSLNRLRPYQQEVAKAVLDSVFGKQGLTFSVEMALGRKVAVIFFDEHNPKEAVVVAVFT